MIFENQHFSALVPFWAVWPFETIVVDSIKARPTDDRILNGIGYAHFYPPLLRSATVRKFMAGYDAGNTAARHNLGDRCRAPA